MTPDQSAPGPNAPWMASPVSWLPTLVTAVEIWNQVPTASELGVPPEPMLVVTRTPICDAGSGSGTVSEAGSRKTHAVTVSPLAGTWPLPPHRDRPTSNVRAVPCALIPIASACAPE